MVIVKLNMSLIDMKYQKGISVCMSCMTLSRALKTLTHSFRHCYRRLPYQETGMSDTTDYIPFNGLVNETTTLNVISSILSTQI